MRQKCLVRYVRTLNSAVSRHGKSVLAESQFANRHFKKWQALLSTLSTNILLALRKSACQVNPLTGAFKENASMAKTHVIPPEFD